MANSPSATAAVAMLSTWTLRRWLFNGFLQQPAPGLSLHSQKQQCSPGRPQPEHFTNLTVCTCVCEDVHTSSFETGRLESEAGNRNHARWEGGVFDNYRSVWAYEYVSVWKREATKLYQTFSAALICMNFTARKSQIWYPSWESCTHTETLTKLSFFHVVRSTSTWLSVSACQSEGFWLYKGKLRTGNRLRSESGRRCWTHPKQKVVSLSQVAIRT